MGNLDKVTGPSGGTAETTHSPVASTVVIIGGGPAGLTAAYELQKHSDSHHPVVFEESDMVGGIARTEVTKASRRMRRRSRFDSFQSDRFSRHSARL